RHALVDRLIQLVTNSQYRARHQRDLDDLPALQRDLLEALRCAALDRDSSAVLTVTRAALELVAFRDAELRPQAVFDLAESGKVERAARRLELFDIDED